MKTSKTLERFKKGEIAIEHKGKEKELMSLLSMTPLTTETFEKYKYICIYEYSTFQGTTNATTKNEIISADDFIRKVEEEMNEFTKDDLKTGMTVKLRNGIKLLVLVGDFKTEIYGKQNIMFMLRNSFFIGSDYDEELKFNKCNDYDIIEVYNPILKGFYSMLSDTYNLIWKRKEKTENEIKIENALEDVRIAQERLDKAKKELEGLQNK